MTNLGTPFIVLIAVEVTTFIFAITRDSSDGWLGSNRDWALLLWFIFTIFALALYGGIYWW